MSILGFFFLLIIILLVFGVSIINGVLRMIFGLGRKNHGGQNTTNNSQRRNQSSSSANQQQSSNTKKIFEKDEGEYVDFEEVDDDK